MDSDSKKLIKFIKELEALKYSERQVYNQHNKGWENYAEHSWHTAIIVWLLSPKYSKKLHLERALKLALLHDIAKLQSGSKPSSDEKAVAKLLKSLPEKQRVELGKLYTEYKQAKTPESKLVNAVNKLQPVILNLLTEGRTWKKFKTTEAMTREQVEPLVQNNPNLTSVFSLLMKEAVDRKLIYRKFWEKFVPKHTLEPAQKIKVAAKTSVTKAVPSKKQAGKPSTTKTKTHTSRLEIQPA